MSDPLLALAERAGLDPGFHDAFGQWHALAPDDRASLLRALGLLADGPDNAGATLARIADAAFTRPLPPVLVLADAPRRVPIALPADAVPPRLRWSLRLESGEVREGEAAFAELPWLEGATLGSRAYERRALALPDDLPTGYHQLSLAEPAAGMALIVAPQRCWQPPRLAAGGRSWGLSVQLYSLRSRRNWGIGDLTDLARLMTMAGRLGAAFVGINPLHARCPFRPQDDSPYSPSDRRFLDIMALDVEAVPDVAEDPALLRRIADPAFQATLARLREAPLVDHPGVAAAKLPLLEAAYANFRVRHLARDTPRAAEFRRFVAAGGDTLMRFARFLAIRAAIRAEGGGVPVWADWPVELQDPTGPAVEALAGRDAAEVEYHLYLQWQAERQLAAVAAAAESCGMAIGLYRDLAVGAARDAAENWSGSTLLAREATIGAPPDLYNRDGQNWGLPPIRPAALREDGYRHFIELLRANMRHAGALRIDHAMALTRLFWIPAGRPGSSGSYVHYPFADLAALVALESQRHRCLVIGEDLGSVPDGFRDRLAERAILSYRVFWFERRPDGGFRPPGEYLAQAIASATTHDLPTLAGFWTARDIERRAELGLYADAAAKERELALRTADRHHLAAALAAAGLPAPDPAVADGRVPAMLAASVHAFIGRSGAQLAAIQLDDVLGELDAVNLPGTFHEYPNWRRKLGRDLEDLEGDARLAALAESMRQAGRAA
jgi:4-alpha-glucanotransferase